jgi:hypothetical protein
MKSAPGNVPACMPSNRVPVPRAPACGLAHNASVRGIVEQLNLKALADGATVAKLRAAGYRTQNALNMFLLARFVLPFVFLVAAVVYVFVLDNMTDKPFTVSLLACIVAAYIGFYTPNMFVSNQAKKRQQSIKLAWPDALDLMLICVESGVSIEAAMKRVAEEIAIQSTALAEEFVLTTAELSYLQDRRMAFENLGSRTGLEQVKSVTQALIQSERYGTPIAQALRVLAQESRDAAHAGSGEEGCRPAAQAHGADDPVLPAGSDRRHPRAGRDPGDGQFLGRRAAVTRHLVLQIWMAWQSAAGNSVRRRFPHPIRLMAATRAPSAGRL